MFEYLKLPQLLLLEMLLLLLLLLRRITEGFHVTEKSSMLQSRIRNVKVKIHEVKNEN